MKNLIRTILGSMILMFMTYSSVQSAEKIVSPVELKEKLKFYHSIQELEVRFHQTKKIHDAEMDIQSEGILRLLPMETVVWEILKPAPLKITLDSFGVEIRGGTKDAPTVQKYSSSQMPKDASSSGYQSLSAWMSLDAEKLSAQYKIENMGVRAYLFTPKKEGPFQSLKMTLSKEGHLENLMIFERSGDQMELKFEHPKVKRKKESPKK